MYNLQLPSTTFSQPRWGRRRATNHKWRGITLHDPAVTPRSTARSVANYTNREGASGWYNYCLDKKELVVYRDPMTHHSAHAKGFNNTCFSCCIVQAAVPLSPVGEGMTRARYETQIMSWCDELRSEGERVDVVERPGSRRFPLALTLSPFLVSEVAKLVALEGERFNIPKTVLVTQKSAQLTTSMIWQGEAVGCCTHRQLIGNSRQDIQPSWLEAIAGELSSTWGWRVLE